MRKRVYLTILVLGIICFTNSLNSGGENMGYSEELAGVKMSYRLEGAYCPYKYIQIDISGEGEVKLDYEVYKEYLSKDEPAKKSIKFKIEKEKIEELVRAYQEVDFFNIEVYDVNRDKVRVTDVGTTTLSLNYAGRKRSLSYGYIEDDPFQKLISLYWYLINKYLTRK